MKSLKPRIKASKINIERLSHTAKQLRREQDERDAKGVQDERAEEACEWCVSFFLPHSPPAHIALSLQARYDDDSLQIVARHPQRLRRGFSRSRTRL